MRWALSSIVLYFQKRRLLRSVFSPISLSCPDRLVTPAAWAGHIPFAFWLIAAHRPRVLVELGTHTGNSYSAFTQAVQANRLDTRCFAVDTWRNAPETFIAIIAITILAVVLDLSTRSKEHHGPAAEDLGTAHGG